MSQQRLAKDELKVKLNKNLCQRARVWANKKIRGRLEDEFNKLFDSVYTLKEADPNGTFDLFVQRPTPSANPIFKRLYVCFGGLKEGFKKHCRPVLSLDGCYLKGDFKGEILASVGRDGNNQIFPVAWAVVEVENRETWAWFLEHIQIDLEIGDGDRFTILSDMQKDAYEIKLFQGLLEEMQLILPNVEHRFCARDMYANWKKENSGHDMQQLFWACCKATTEAEFHKHSTRMATLKDTALSSHKCTCRYWDLTGIPCSHSICVILFNYKPLERYVDEAYRKENYQSLYHYALPTIPSEAFWKDTKMGPLEPPVKRKLPGRPKQKRKREEGETTKGFKLSKRGSECTCTCCGCLDTTLELVLQKTMFKHRTLHPCNQQQLMPHNHLPLIPLNQQPLMSHNHLPFIPLNQQPVRLDNHSFLILGILQQKQKPGRPSQMLVRRPNTRSHATLSEPLIPSQPAPLSQQSESTHPAPVYQPAVMSTTPSTSTNMETSSINYSQERGLVKQPLGSSMNI
ncbi:hypothetical protein V6N13_129501 [Hibiscus sabdariffa]